MTDGRLANVVLVGPRQNAKAAVLVLPPSKSGEAVNTMSLAEGLSMFQPRDVLEALCMQERAFGSSGLAAPAESTEPA